MASKDDGAEFRRRGTRLAAAHRLESPALWLLLAFCGMVGCIVAVASGLDVGSLLGPAR